MYRCLSLFKLARSIVEGPRSNSLKNNMPVANPPTCAQNAIPAPLGFEKREAVPLKSCTPNQKARYMNADISKKYGSKKMGMRKIILLWGNISI